VEYCRPNKYSSFSSQFSILSESLIN